MKLLLAVIDGCKPSMLERAVERGEAPVIAAVVQRGTFVDELCAAFPSVTPVCATSIATGALQDRHGIAAMNWWSRAERRYVEYGSSFRAARKLGIARQLTDTVYNLNGSHLSRDVETVYESLDDLGVRTAGTTYLVYRGRHEHPISRETALTRLAGTLFRKPVMGPRELFYADIFASRQTGCRSQLGMPGIRDRHAGCVSAWLAARDLYDFLLLSLPDNDTHSHKNGPHAQPASIAAADRELQRVADAVGGIDALLDTHAVIVCADHSHAAVERRIELREAFSDWAVAGPGGSAVDEAELALCPNQRAAMIYALVPEARATVVPRIVETATALAGIDVIAWREGDRAAVRAPGRGELFFAPGSALRDARGNAWTVEGDLSALAAHTSTGRFEAPDYPDALRRVWAALTCATAGDVLLSAGPGYEFPDWGGADHVGGGSHGSLHRSDSLGALAFSGVAAPAGTGPGAWSITDVAPMVRAHFGAS
ncbi:MAG TPA: alkaline phosphatase family protein [Baekduia sp.]|uniref:alkaline phosphatase family protein n=1 Tax=Baekduia sp. TaxID=2600305 RepID=UPI002D1AB3E7|nr:alkaline phosphatase family protein [Baekduia sp.]HMJ35650.1 alkaline phosphatase family protein [Baekduia sp.]